MSFFSRMTQMVTMDPQSAPAGKAQAKVGGFFKQLESIVTMDAPPPAAAGGQQPQKPAGGFFKQLEQVVTMDVSKPPVQQQQQQGGGFLQKLSQVVTMEPPPTATVQQATKSPSMLSGGSSSVSMTGQAKTPVTAPPVGQVKAPVTTAPPVGQAKAPVTTTATTVGQAKVSTTSAPSIGVEPIKAPLPVEQKALAAKMSVDTTGKTPSSTEQKAGAKLPTPLSNETPRAATDASLHKAPAAQSGRKVATVDQASPLAPVEAKQAASTSAAPRSTTPAAVKHEVVPVPAVATTVTKSTTIPTKTTVGAGQATTVTSATDKKAELKKESTERKPSARDIVKPSQPSIADTIRPTVQLTTVRSEPVKRATPLTAVLLKPRREKPTLANSPCLQQILELVHIVCNEQRKTTLELRLVSKRFSRTIGAFLKLELRPNLYKKQNFYMLRLCSNRVRVEKQMSELRQQFELHFEYMQKQKQAMSMFKSKQYPEFPTDEQLKGSEVVRWISRITIGVRELAILQQLNAIGVVSGRGQLDVKLEVRVEQFILEDYGEYWLYDYLNYAAPPVELRQDPNYCRAPYSVDSAKRKLFNNAEKLTFSAFSSIALTDVDFQDTRSSIDDHLLIELFRNFIAVPTFRRCTLNSLSSWLNVGTTTPSVPLESSLFYSLAQPLPFPLPPCLPVRELRLQGVSGRELMQIPTLFPSLRVLRASWDYWPLSDLNWLEKLTFLDTLDVHVERSHINPKNAFYFPQRLPAMTRSFSLHVRGDCEFLMAERVQRLRLHCPESPMFHTQFIRTLQTRKFFRNLRVLELYDGRIQFDDQLILLVGELAKTCDRMEQLTIRVPYALYRAELAQTKLDVILRLIAQLPLSLRVFELRNYVRFGDAFGTRTQDNFRLWYLKIAQEMNARQLRDVRIYALDERTFQPTLAFERLCGELAGGKKPCCAHKLDRRWCRTEMSKGHNTKCERCAAIFYWQSDAVWKRVSLVSTFRAYPQLMCKFCTVMPEVCDCWECKFGEETLPAIAAVERGPTEVQPPARKARLPIPPGQQPAGIPVQVPAAEQKQARPVTFGQQQLQPDLKPEIQPQPPKVAQPLPQQGAQPQKLKEPAPVVKAPPVQPQPQPAPAPTGGFFSQLQQMVTMEPQPVKPPTAAVAPPAATGGIFGKLQQMVTMEPVPQAPPPQQKVVQVQKPAVVAPPPQAPTGFFGKLQQMVTMEAPPPVAPVQAQQQPKPQQPQAAPSGGGFLSQLTQMVSVEPPKPAAAPPVQQQAGPPRQVQGPAAPAAKPQPPPQQQTGGFFSQLTQAVPAASVAQQAGGKVAGFMKGFGFKF